MAKKKHKLKDQKRKEKMQQKVSLADYAMAGDEEEVKEERKDEKTEKPKDEAKMKVRIGEVDTEDTEATEITEEKGSESTEISEDTDKKEAEEAKPEADGVEKPEETKLEAEEEGDGEAEAQKEEVVEGVFERGAGKKALPGHIVINDAPSVKSKWYVVHTYTGHEGRVAQQLLQRLKTQNLDDRVFEILIPTQEKIQVRQGKKEKIKDKIFPGYMLIRMIMDDPTWLAVRTTQGITGFVGMGNKPTPISPQEVKNIQRFAATAAPRFKTKFSVNEAIRIIDGPFADFLGTIDKIDEEKGKLRVLVSIFGRETPVELDFLQVKKV
jgi:transcriptional antiterminator NusG